MRNLVLTTAILSFAAGTASAAQYPAYLKGPRADEMFIANRSPEQWPALLDYYSNRVAKDGKDFASVLRALDIAALYSSASGTDVGMVNRFGGRALDRAYHVVSYDNYFPVNFSVFSGSSSSRRKWRGKDVVVAVSTPGCDIGVMISGRNDGMGGRAADWAFGVSSPYKGNAFFRVALTPSKALNEADVEYAMASCRRDNSVLGFARYVVHGQLACSPVDCTGQHQFLINHVSYAWNTQGIGGYLGNTYTTNKKLRSVFGVFGVK